jgi:hypothetical protein
MRTSGELIDPAHVCKAIYEKKGVVQYAADIVPCDVTTIYRLMKTHPEVKQAVDEAREMAKQERIDRNEVLRAKAYKSAEQLLDNFDTTMTIFSLKYLCDWEEKQNSSINIEIVDKPYRDENNTASSVRVPEVSDTSVGSA